MSGREKALEGRASPARERRPVPEHEDVEGAPRAGGTTTSYGAGGKDYWLLKLGPSGDVSWQSAYGGAYDDDLAAVASTADGGYILAGSTLSFGTGAPTYLNALVMKVTSTGAITWQRAYGDGYIEKATAVCQAADGGYLVAASVAMVFGSPSIWLLKLGSTGSVQWQRTYGGSAVDTPVSLAPLRDGGALLAARTTSFGAGSDDALLVRVDPTGALVWRSAYGGASSDQPTAAVELRNGAIVMSGTTTSFGVNSGAGFSNLWALGLTSAGAIAWQRTYGGNADDLGGTVSETADGGLLLSGVTSSYGAGSSDLWLLKTDANGLMGPASCAAAGASGATVSTSSLAPGTRAIVTVGAPAPVVATSATRVASSATIAESCGIHLPDEVSPPGAAQPLVFVSTTSLLWEGGAGSGATSFNLYRGSIASLPAQGYGTCLLSGLGSPTGSDASTPPPGQCWFYIVTGKNGLGEGPMGHASSGLARPNDTPCP